MPILDEERREEHQGPRDGHFLVVVVPEVRCEQRKERNREQHARERQPRPERQRPGDVLELRFVAGRRRGQEPRGDEGAEHDRDRANRGTAADQRLPAIRWRGGVRRRSWWKSGSRQAGRTGTRCHAPPSSCGTAASSPTRPTRCTAWRRTRAARPRWHNSIASRDGPSNSAMPLIAAGIEQVEARAAACWAPARGALRRRFWPGPLTLVLPAWPGLDAERARGPGDRGGARAGPRAWRGCWPEDVRVANHVDKREPIGPAGDQRSRRGAGGIGRRPRRLIDAGPSPGGAPSTIVDATRRRAHDSSAPAPCRGTAC